MPTFLSHSSWLYPMPDISELVGKTIVKIDGAEKESEEIHFVCSDGSEYLMHHEQDCCEWVRVEEIIGNVGDLLNSPISMAECVSEHGEKEDGFDWGTKTWTFYKFATVKGYVTLRWLGESNGYYSEAVDFLRIKNPGGGDAYGKFVKP